MILFKRPAFFRDLERYTSLIAADNPEAARRFIDAAEKACALIQKHPEIGSQEAFRKHHEMRSWRIEGFDNYLIPKLSDFMRRSFGIFWHSGAWANAASIKRIHFTFAQAPECQNLLKSHPQQSLNLGYILPKEGGNGGNFTIVAWIVEFTREISEQELRIPDLASPRTC